MAGAKVGLRGCHLIRGWVLRVLLFWGVVYGAVRGREVVGGTRLTVNSGGDLYSKLCIMHLTWDFGNLLVEQKGMSMEELKLFPSISIPRNLVMRGEGGGDRPPAIKAGECVPRISLNDDVRVEMDELTIDVRYCEQGIVQSVVDGERGWLFRLGLGSTEVYKRSRILMQAGVIKAIGDHAGVELVPGVPQNLTLSLKNESETVVTFVDVLFTAVDEAHTAPHMAEPTKVHNVDSRDKLKQVLSAPSGGKKHIEVLVENSIVDACDAPVKPLVHPEKRGYTLTMKSIGDLHGIGCSLLTFSSAVLAPQRFVTLENLLFYAIEDPSFLFAPKCQDLACFRHSWASVFPSASEDYQCRVLVRNSTSISTCRAVALMTQLLDIVGTPWFPIKMNRLIKVKYEVPFASIQIVDKLSLKIEKFAFKGLCMENVMVSCDQQSVAKELSALSHHPVKASTVSTVVVPLTATAGIILFLCVGGGCIWVFLMRVKRRAHGQQLKKHTRSLQFSLSGSLHSLGLVPPPTSPTEGSLEGGDDAVHQKPEPLNGTPRARHEPTDHDNNSFNGVVEIKQQIGAGGYGVVYRGEWKGLPVAVKTVTFHDHPGGEGKERQRAILEAAISSALAHKNIVQTHAYCFVPVETPSITPGLKQLAGASNSRNENLWRMLIVQEYCDEGSLRMGLRRRLFTDPATQSLDLYRVLEIALDISRGMEHLHSTGIIHGDLTSKNVLLKSADSSSAISDLTAKIADFGLSVKVGRSEDPVKNHHAGTPFYVAPEVYNDGVLSKSADVFSFGVVLWELYHQRTSFESMRKGRYKYHHRFPKFPVQCPLPYALLCIVCLSSNPENRPDFSFIIWALGRLLRKWNRKGCFQGIKQENTKHAADLEGMEFEDIPGFLESLLEDDCVPHGDSKALYSSAQGAQFHEDVAHGRLAITSRNDVDAVNHLGSLGQKSYNSLMSTQNSQWEEQVDEIIAAGVGLSVTVLPATSGASDSQTDNWTGTGSLSHFHTSSSFNQTRAISEAGGSNVFSVTVDDGSFGGDMNITCGDLVFKWDATVTLGKHPSSSNFGPLSSVVAVGEASMPLSWRDEETHKVSYLEEHAPLPRRLTGVAENDTLTGDLRGQYNTKRRHNSSSQISQHTGSDISLPDGTKSGPAESGAWNSDGGTGQDATPEATEVDSATTSSEHTMEPIALPDLLYKPTFVSENPLYNPVPQSIILEMG